MANRFLSPCRHTTLQVFVTGLGVVLSLLLSPLRSAEYHVMTSGDDNANGSSGQPWRTLGRAADAAHPGDTIFVHPGTYALTQQIAFPRSGTADHPIRVEGPTGGTALIQGGSTLGSCLSLQFRSHIHVRNLAFTTTSTVVGASMVYLEDTDFCEFHDCHFSGMPPRTGSENTAVIRCMGVDDGFSTGCVFRNNLFINNASPAIRTYDTDGWLIEHNEFRNCLQAVDGKDQPFNMVVRRNLVVGGDLAFMFSGQGGSNNVAITENIVVGAQSVFQIGGQGTYGNLRDDIRIFNNAFVNCHTFMNGWDDGFTRRHQAFNNIFFASSSANIGHGEDIAGRFFNLDKYGTTPLNTTHYLLDWNCYSIPAGDTSWHFVNASIQADSLAEWQDAHPPLETHSITADPLFRDIADNDFRLQAGSPCRGTGRDGLDMGAYPNGEEDSVIGRLSAAAPATTHAQPLGFTPTILINAEDGTLGATHQGAGSTRWSDAAGNTTVSDVLAFDGSLSFRCHADVGTVENEGQFGSWGGRKSLPAALVRGDTLHVQFSAFLPDDFDWTANPWLKFARIHIRTAGGGNVGYHDIYIHQDGNLAYHSEVVGFVDRIAGQVMTKGRWETFEMAVTLDAVAADDGGEGRVRIWRYVAGTGMQPIYENTARKTLNVATDRCDAFLLFTYWNSRSDLPGNIVYPLTEQDCWVDRIVIEPDPSRLTETDAHGRSIIGGVSATLPENRTPIANARAVSTTINTPVTLVLTGSDADGDPLTVAIATPPTHGTVTPVGNSWRYTPDADYVGSDSFRFTVSDGEALSASALVSIQVTATEAEEPGTEDGGGDAASSCGSGFLVALLMLVTCRLTSPRCRPLI